MAPKTKLPIKQVIKIPISHHGFLEISRHEGMIIGVAIHFSKRGRYDSQTQAKKRHDEDIFTDAGKNPVTKVVRIKGTRVLKRQTELSIKRRKTVIKKIPSIKANIVANFTSTSEI